MSSENMITFKNIDDKIKLYNTVSSILNESNNEKLTTFCRSYLDKINEGVSEAVLYESFISGAANWNFLGSVETELSALAKRVDKFKQEIDLSKIVNTMKETSSSYLVPLIEEVVLNYMNNKSVGNRTILKDRLLCFHHDPFIKEMLNVLYYDKSINESLKNNIVNNKITIKKIFSPLYHIKENEIAFNVAGQYYSRKGNTINRIPKANHAQLNEEFRNLCNIVNGNNIVVNEHNNTIELFAGNKTAIINENNITLDGEVISLNDLNEAAKISLFTNDGYANFYNTINKINENFDNIAPIDFVTRIELNENRNVSVDLFKLKESIYITTNDDLGRHTFYRNVNPIQASHIINEHMNLNVSDLFEELQPDQKKIKNEIEETKKSYEDAINEFKNKINELKSCKEGADNADVASIDEAIKLLEDELEKTEQDYKEYQKNSDAFLNGEDGEVDADDPAFNTEASETGDIDNDETDTKETDDYIDDVKEPISDEPIEYNPLFDETPTEAVDAYAPQVVKVSYATNIKTEAVINSGEVHLLVPSVNSNGDVTNELQKITFYLDDNRMPIINNEYMPVAIYNIIKAAIENDPMTAEIDVTNTAVPSDTITEPAITNSDQTEPTEENPIDAAYGTEDIVSENPEAEPDEVADEVDNIISTDEVIEPETTENSAPMDLESNDNETGLIKLEMTNSEFIHEGIDKEDLLRFLSKRGISFDVDDNNVTIHIINAEQSNALKKYFCDWEDWSVDEFYRFFYELNVYRAAYENKVVLRYSAKLENLLESEKLSYKVSKKGDKVMILNAVNEGVVITVTDDKTGKTVTINTDELNDKAENAEHEENTQDDVTFNDNNADTEKSEETNNEQNESTDNITPSQKKFVFRVKKHKTDESLGVTEYDNALNESEDAEASVMDEVKYKGSTGQVVSKLNNGDIIISVNGGTETVKPSQIKIVAGTCEIESPIEDAKPDKSMVSCGIFVNECCISPTDCLTNKELFESANENDMIDIIVEGVSQPLAKKYVKIFE